MVNQCLLKFGHFVFILTIIATSMQWAIEDCQTPNKEGGTCRSVYSCKPMMDALDKMPQDMPEDMRKFLRGYLCDYDGTTPKVCCPFKTIPLPVTTHLRMVEDLPPDVDRHANIKLLPTEECGLASTSERIVYGNKTGVFEYPWMAMLWYRNVKGSKYFACGGTLINNRYILTAAHCINNKLTAVRLGEHDIRTEKDCEIVDEEEYCAPPYKELTIEKIIKHELYNKKSFKYDIALLRIPPIEYSDSIKPICLPLNKARTFNLTNRNGVVTGWGNTENGISSPELLQANLPIVPLDECQERYKDVAKLKSYREMATLNQRQFCAGGSVLSDSCGGDSGGPFHVLMRLHGDMRLVQQGIVSFGPTKCGRHIKYPGVYTNVVYYMKWILDNIEP